MKVLIFSLTATLLAASFAVSADAATTKQQRQALAQREASCKAQAAKKYSMIHFLKRRDFVNNCMGRSAYAKAVMPAKKKAQPTTTGQSTK